MAVVEMGFEGERRCRGERKDDLKWVVVALEDEGRGGTGTLQNFSRPNKKY